MKTLDASRRSFGREDERAQVLLLFALLIVPVSLVMGLIAVDVSLWHSERRGAQKDADFTALSGAYKLLALTPVAADAIAAANAAADINDEAGNADIASLAVGTGCFGSGDRVDSVAVDIRHNSRTLFGDAFGLSLGPDAIGAHARACAGSVVSTSGLRPYGIESEPACLSTNTCTVTSDSRCFTVQGGKNLPVFGSACQLDDGSHAGTPSRGLVGLGPTAGDACGPKGAKGNDLPPNVRNGAGATCRIGDTVYPVPGSRPGEDINQGLSVLLAGGGDPPVADGVDCDAKFGNGDHIDDFAEVLERIDGGPSGPSPTALFQFRACVSPRVVHVVIVDRMPTAPSDTGTIVGFAAFYILGCKTESQPMTVLPNRCSTGAPGHLQLWGIFFNKLELKGDVGQWNPFGTNKIALVE